MKHDYQFHINGLKGIKPYLQQLMLTTNYEGMGETDAKEIGETIDLAIEALEKQIPKKVIKYKRIGDVLIGGYCPACGAELHISNRPCYCGQVLNWDGVK